MYSVRLGYDEAIQRIETLARNGHHAEAFVTSVFTVEKTLRRTLRQLVVSAGFTSKQADKIVGRCRGFDALKDSWDLYDPRGRKLTEIIPQADWKQFKAASSMRNELIHGVRVFGLERCRQEAKATLLALGALKTTFESIYGYSGWEVHSKRTKPALHYDPKVKL